MLNIIRVIAIAWAACVLSTCASEVFEPNFIREDAIALLKKAKPRVPWDVGFHLDHNLTCTGELDYLSVSTDGESVWVGYVPSVPRASRPTIMQFPIGKWTQGSFCKLPMEMQSYPNKCEAEGGSTLPGCMRGRWNFSLVDNECDAFNFYWDTTQKKLVW